MGKFSFLAVLVSATLGIQGIAHSQDGGVRVLETLDARDATQIKAMFGNISSSCAGVLAGNIYDQHLTLGYDYQANRLHSWACSSNFSSSSEMTQSAAALGIPIYDIPIKVSFSDDQQEFRQSLRKWCTSDYRQLYNTKFRTEYSNIISTSLVGAFKSCLDAEKEAMLQRFGAYAYAVPENDNMQSFLVTLFVRPMDLNGGAVIRSIEGSVTCSMNGKQIEEGHRLNTAETVMTCKKPGGVRAALSINTEPTNRTPDISLPEMGEDRLRKLEGDLANLSYLVAVSRQDIHRLSMRGPSFSKFKFLPREDHQAYAGCPAGMELLDQYCTGDCSGDDARVTVCGVPNDREEIRADIE